MDAARLKLEKERLQKLYAASQQQLASVTDELTQTKAQHQAVTEQFTITLEEKDRQVASLEHRIKLLLLKIRGSRQEKIDPDQLVLFSVDELQELADELDRSATKELVPDEERKLRNRSGGRRRLPKDLPREVVRHELGDEDRACPCCGQLRREIGVESSEQLEYIPARWKVIQHDRVKYACRDC